MGIKEKLTKKYKTKDLYVGLLGIVYCKFLDWDDEEFSCKSVNRYVIYRKKKYVPAAGGFCGDYVGQDLFTNREYFFFRGNKVYKAVGSLAICKFYPLELFLPNLRDTVTKSELLELYNIFNKDEKKIEDKEKEESDQFVKTLSEMDMLLQTTLIDENSKKKIGQKLEELRQYYIDAEIDALIYKSNNEVKSRRRTK